jgi:hypothetical protein
MGIDPLYIHRIFRLAEYLEVEEDDLTLVDESEYVFSHDGDLFRVLAEDELENILRKKLPRGHRIDPRVLVEYMQLPSAQRIILEILQPDEQPRLFDEEAERVLLSEEERQLDDLIRSGASADQITMPTEDELEERSGRFFIYQV